MTQLRHGYVLEHGKNIRLHGNGFIQLDVDDLRIHIWHANPAIRSQIISTQIHNHRFSFISQVLTGRLLHTAYKMPLPVNNEMKGKTYYQLYKAHQRDKDDTILVLDSHAKFVFREEYRLQLTAGSTYTFESGLFHESGSVGFTATILRKTNTETMTPLVACKSNEQPDNDFNRYQIDEQRLWAEVDRLFDVLPERVIKITI